MAALSFNQIIWKEITSCCRYFKPKCKVEECFVKCTSFLKIFGFASIAPSVWLAGMSVFWTETILLVLKLICHTKWRSMKPVKM